MHQNAWFYLCLKAEAAAHRVVPLERPEMAGAGSCNVAGGGDLWWLGGIEDLARVRAI